MEHAITELERALKTARINGPIYRRDGRDGLADEIFAVAGCLEAAIEVLKSAMDPPVTAAEPGEIMPPPPHKYMVVYSHYAAFTSSLIVGTAFVQGGPLTESLCRDISEELKTKLKESSLVITSITRLDPEPA